MTVLELDAIFRPDSDPSVKSPRLPAPQALPTPTIPDAWFAPGQRAPSHDSFPSDAGGCHLTDGTKGPDWIDYLYELHNRGLILVNGWIMRDAECVI